MNPSIHVKKATLGFVVTLVCFGLLPKSQAVNPPPDGGYPGANTAEGKDALFSLTSGIANTAVGLNALHDNTTGGWNVAIGSSALANNTTGNFNMAVGTDALRDNNANFNLAIGFRVGFMNTTGNHLTGIGAAALRNNTTAGFNTAIGADALRENTTGENNTAIGADALAQNTIAEDNTAVGAAALSRNTTGIDNIAVGSLAGDLLTTGSNNIDIGNEGEADDANTIRIGPPGVNSQNRTFIAGIHGTSLPPDLAIPVVIEVTGQLGTLSSSARFKNDIKPMDDASKAILALKPVSFHYKSDAKSTPCFGLIAEEVEKVNPDLIVRDKDGKPYSVRYDQVNAMLLNEFLKEHRKVEALQASFAQQQRDFQATVAQQQKQIEALTAGLQKVTSQLEASKPAHQVVNNP